MTTPYDPFETSSAEERAEVQKRRLLRTLERVAVSVPHYAESFAAAGVDLAALREADGEEGTAAGILRTLPFTTKDDLREHYPFGLFAKPLDDVVRVHASSGTTGQPTVVGYTRDDIELWSSVMARTFVLGGVGPEDVIHNAYGYGLFTGGLGAHYGGEALGATVVPMSGGNTPRQLMLLRDFGATVICCTPSYALNMVEAAEEAEVDFEQLPLRVGFFGAEPWSDEMRLAIEARVHLQALDVYGLSEIIGPGVASECLEQDGLHIADDHFIPEVIDPASGEPLPAGELGELVFTCVTKQALPLVRYRTRDLTRLTYEPCACGRTTARMERVTGRNDDMLIVRGVNVFPSQVEAAIVGLEGASPHYQLVVDRTERHLDRLGVRVEALPAVWADADLRAGLQSQLTHAIQTTLGIRCDVELAAPNAVPRSEGKAVRVVDRRAL